MSLRTSTAFKYEFFKSVEEHLVRKVLRCKILFVQVICFPQQGLIERLLRTKHLIVYSLRTTLD